MQISPISYPCLLEQQAGHTLIELLVGLTVSSILLASAAPMFAGMLMNNRATTLAKSAIGISRSAKAMMLLAAVAAGLTAG